jgi:hypothetical protein
MSEPTKSVDELMAELRRDVDAWKAKLGALKADDQYAGLVEKIEGWIKEAERVLARWNA